MKSPLVGSIFLGLWQKIQRNDAIDWPKQSRDPSDPVDLPPMSPNKIANRNVRRLREVHAQLKQHGKELKTRRRAFGDKIDAGGASVMGLHANCVLNRMIDDDRSILQIIEKRIAANNDSRKKRSDAA